MTTKKPTKPETKSLRGSAMPKVVPEGWALVHNHVYPDGKNAIGCGTNGLRCSLMKRSYHALRRCRCKFAPGLKHHTIGTAKVARAEAMAKRSDDERTAYHEAAHAVLAHFLDFSVKRVSVIPDHAEGEAGSVTHADEWDEEHEELRTTAEDAFWLRYATARYAGAEAERRLAPKSRWRTGAAGDYKWAARAIDKMLGDPESQRAAMRYAM